MRRGSLWIIGERTLWTERGAFTSAVSQKLGRIELADKGTLFLDEIGELPLELQPKLLRVLQDREFERLGGVHTLHVDVRIIAATNRDLRQDIADKKFRDDLFSGSMFSPSNSRPSTRGAVISQCSSSILSESMLSAWENIST